MTRPYSEDLRERAVARFEAGETTRSIAVALRISPSCVSKWIKRKRETGSLAQPLGRLARQARLLVSADLARRKRTRLALPLDPLRHKKPSLSGEPAEWL